MIRRILLISIECRKNPLAMGHEVEVVESGGVPFEVSIIEALGAESYAHGMIGGANVIARVDAGAGIKKGQTIRVALQRVHLFDAKSGASLRAA